MNRSRYFDYIEKKINELSLRISTRGKLNILDLNMYSETFYADLCNILFDLNLSNLNEYNQNSEGIDLVDTTNKIVVQVSSISTKQKIEESLRKDIFSEYEDYKYKFLSISKDASTLRNKTFKNPHNIIFNPKEDIIDPSYILRKILYKSIDEQKSLYEFIKKELGEEINLIKFDTNIATIINILADENLIENIDSPEIDCFEIDRKIAFNNLINVEDTINDYKIYYHKLNEKYSEFDREASNKSFSVFQIIRKQYKILQTENKCSHTIFLGIVNNIIDIIINSSNYFNIPYDELEVCVDILVVDAFVRCKIFKNPEGYKHVITR